MTDGPGGSVAEVVGFGVFIEDRENLIMIATADVSFRTADADDALAIAMLHGDSWRRHYRGAYSDSFLDGDVVGYLARVWTDRLGSPRPPASQPPASQPPASQPPARQPPARTILAERDGEVVGLAHTFLDADPTWGALLDNLHVAHGLKRHGIGRRLLALTRQAVRDWSESSSLYLWVLEQNSAAQAFYAAQGGARVERAVVPPPGGDPSNLTGNPMCFRYAWPTP